MENHRSQDRGKHKEKTGSQSGTRQLARLIGVENRLTAAREKMTSLINNKKCNWQQEM